MFKRRNQKEPYMIKPNQHELSQALGIKPSSKEDYIRALNRFKEIDICFPVITLGEKGCVAALPDGIYYFYAPPIKVVNVVGSGDSFVAGCAVALSRGMEPVDHQTGNGLRFG